MNPNPPNRPMHRPGIGKEEPEFSPDEADIPSDDAGGTAQDLADEARSNDQAHKPDSGVSR